MFGNNQTVFKWSDVSSARFADLIKLLLVKKKNFIIIDKNKYKNNKLTIKIKYLMFTLQRI